MIFIKPELLWLTLIVMSIFTAFIALKITNFIAILTNNTKLGGAAAGMIIVSIISSLPELVVIITSNVNATPYLGLSDVIGANMFTTVMVALSALIFATRAKITYVTKANIICFLGALLMYGVIIGTTLIMPVYKILPIALGNSIKISIPLIAIAVIYFGVIVTTGEEEEQWKEDHFLTEDSKKLISEKDKETIEKPKYKINTYIILTITFALLLIGSAVVLSKLADIAASDEGYGLGHGFAGALILAFVTSLPEISSLFNLTKLGLRNIAIAGVAGSHIFNFFLLFVGDFFYTNNTGDSLIDSVYESANNNTNEIISMFGLTSLLTIMLLLSFTKKISVTKWSDYIRFAMIAIFIGGWLFIKLGV